VVDLLSDMINDSEELVQGKAAMALGVVRTEKAKAYLLAAYGRRSRTTRQQIVEALRVAGVAEPMAAAVAAEGRMIWERNLRTLLEGAPAERVGAAEDLGRSGRPQAVDRLLGMVGESQVVLAAAAARGLAYSGDPRALETFIDLLNEGAPELREAACRGLAAIRDVRSLGALIQVALEESALSRLAGATLLAMPTGPRSDAALCELIQSGNRPQALAAGAAMRKRGGCPLAKIANGLSKRGASALKSKAGEAKVISALIAVEALGPIAQELAGAVLRWTGDPTPRVRREAQMAIAEVGGPSASAAIRDLYDQQRQRLQKLRAGERATADRLAPTTPEQSEDQGLDDRSHQLMRRLERRRASQRNIAARLPSASRREVAAESSEAEVEVLATLVRALGGVGGPEARRALSQEISDPSPRVRSSACAGLAHLGPEGIPQAQGCLGDQDPTVRKSAAEALAAQGEAGQGVLLEFLAHKKVDPGVALEALAQGPPLLVKDASALAPSLSLGGLEAVWAAQLLGEVGDENAADELLGRLRHTAGAGRRATLEALGRTGSARAAKPLAEALFHEAPEIRAAAVEALGKVGDSLHAQSLKALKADYYREVREAADRAIATLGSKTEAAQRHGSQ
jgi:HEAT repeat protein